MGWAAGIFGEGGAVLVVGCLVGMGLLMWLLLRLTGDSAARVDVQPPRQVVDQLFSDGLIDADAYARARLRIDEHAPTVPGSSVKSWRRPASLHRRSTGSPLTFALRMARPGSSGPSSSTVPQRMSG